MGLRHGTHVWTLNAPIVDHTDISAYIEQTALLTGIQPPQSRSNSVHINTTGISIISQLHGGLEGTHILSATQGASYGSVVALQISRLQERLLNENPKIQNSETLVALTKEYALNPTRGEQIFKMRDKLICPRFNGQSSGRLNVGQFEVYRR